MIRTKYTKECTFMYDDRKKDREFCIGGHVGGRHSGDHSLLNKKEARALWRFLDEVFGRKKK